MAGRKEKKTVSSPSESAPPNLVRRKQNQNSVYKMGRTIGEKRERIETANERAAARKQDKKRQAKRVIFTIVGFVILAGVLIFLCFFFVGTGEPRENITSQVEESTVTTEPTIEIVDEDAKTAGEITNRMRAYIGQAEQDFRDLGYEPVKAVVPANSVREVDFYLKGQPGFIKMHIDRGTAVSVEDADRMIRYLQGQNVSNPQYIDVRISGKAYWK